MAYNVSFDASSLVSAVATSQRDVEKVKIMPLKRWQKFVSFHRAPITKFWTNVVSGVYNTSIRDNTSIIIYCF